MTLKFTQLDTPRDDIVGGGKKNNTQIHDNRKKPILNIKS